MIKMDLNKDEHFSKLVDDFFNYVGTDLFNVKKVFDFLIFVNVGFDLNKRLLCCIYGNEIDLICDKLNKYNFMKNDYYF